MAFSDLSDYSNHETCVFDHCWQMFGEEEWAPSLYKTMQHTDNLIRSQLEDTDNLIRSQLEDTDNLIRSQLEDTDNLIRSQLEDTNI